jgi:hypothetical protein
MRREMAKRERKWNLRAHLPLPVKSQINLPRRVQPLGCGPSARFAGRGQFDRYVSCLQWKSRLLTENRCSILSLTFYVKFYIFLKSETSVYICAFSILNQLNVLCQQWNSFIKSVQVNSDRLPVQPHNCMCILRSLTVSSVQEDVPFTRPYRHGRSHKWQIDNDKKIVTWVHIACPLQGQNLNILHELKQSWKHGMLLLS